MKKKRVGKVKKTVDVAEMTRKLKNEIQRKILKVEELPEGFYYMTDTHIVEGTGKFIYTDALRDGITVGMEDGTIIVGTKKGHTAATGAHSEKTIN
jgi:hypothetical protein